MNAVEFLAEVLKSNECPANFEEIYKEFRLFQEASLSTLKEFHRVCEKNKIEYQLSYGSLLGVIRDGGQIPWDYDIDVILPYNEKENLVSALEKDLNDKFYYYCPDNDRKCRHMIMRLAPREYRTEALHVDVFFLIGTPEDKLQRKIFEKKVAKISRMRYGKFVNLKEESTGDIRTFISLLFKKKFPSLFISTEQIEKQYRALCEKYPPNSSSICIEADVYAQLYEFPSWLMWKTRLVATDFGEIRIPENYDELLKLVYGNYMDIPPLKNRINEVLRNYRRIKIFQNYKK